MGMELLAIPTWKKVAIQTAVMTRRVMKDAIWYLMLSLSWMRPRGRTSAIVIWCNYGVRNERAM